MAVESKNTAHRTSSLRLWFTIGVLLVFVCCLSGYDLYDSWHRGTKVLLGDSGRNSPVYFAYRESLHDSKYKGGKYRNLNGRTLRDRSLLAMTETNVSSLLRHNTASSTKSVDDYDTRNSAHLTAEDSTYTINDPGGNHMVHSLREAQESSSDNIGKLDSPRETQGGSSDTIQKSNSTRTTEEGSDNGVNKPDLPPLKQKHRMLIDTPPPGYVRPSTTTLAPFTKSWNDPVDCALLYKENKYEIKHALERRTRIVAQVSYDYSPVLDAESCDSYVAAAGYVTDILSEEEKNFPLAFAIRMHNNPVQAERLLKAIYRPQNYYCIYVDKKADNNTHTVMAKIVGCLRNVFLASHTNNYIYASFSAVEADMQCMKDLAQRSDSWKYFMNMAGTEFPLKTNLEIVRVLKVLNGTNDVEQYPFPKFYRKRIHKHHTAIGQTWTETRIPKKPFPDPAVTPQKGCAYNTLSRAFVEWVLTDDLAQRFINWTRDLYSPDEVVWATLNSLPQAPGGYPDVVAQMAKTFLSREVIWSNSVAYCHESKMVRGICIMSFLELGYLSRRWEFFANKFDIGYDPIVLDCLAESLVARTRKPDPDHYVHWGGVYRAPHVRRARGQDA